MARKTWRTVVGGAIHCVAAALACAACGGQYEATEESATGAGAAAPQANSPSNGTGSLELVIDVIPDGAVVSYVAYEITFANGSPLTGQIRSAGSSQVRTTVAQLAAGAGYKATVHSAGGGDAACLGSVVFDVTAGKTTTSQVKLVCSGAIHNPTPVVHVHICPELDPLAITMLAPHQFELRASAHDAGGDPLTFAWTASAGTFDAPLAATTRYECVGKQTVTVTVSDGQGCDTPLTQTILCAP